MSSTVLLSSFGIFTGLFGVYSQYAIGNVLYRPDSTGEITFQPRSLLKLMASPFVESTLWNPKFFDINYIIFTGTGMLITYGLYRIIK